MKRNYLFILPIAVLGMTLFVNSCSPSTSIIARNTTDIATLEEMNLIRDDYEIIDVITANATVTFDAKKRKTYGENNEFVLRYRKLKGTNELESGMLRFGYFYQDVISNTTVEKGGLFRRAKYRSKLPVDPETIARRWATYRLIAEAKAMGADALIVPVRSSDISSGGKDISIVKTTVTAKAVRLYNN